MTNRSEFLKETWTEIINAPMAGAWIENAIAVSQRRPNDPFADLGPALKRLLAAGVERRDLCLIARWASYEAAFQVLYKIDDMDDGNHRAMHEDLLTADPSGKDGRPGSAP